MIDPKVFFQELGNNGVDFFAGVPDSLLKHFCNTVIAYATPASHVIAANEGAAVGLAIGHYLATKNLPLVYMQNSGLGNVVNPITSLADPEVYGTPMLLMIGWRGEPNKPDEPQHVKQGRITKDLLDVLEIPYTVLSGQENDIGTVLSHAVNSAKASAGPHALLIRKGAFKEFPTQNHKSQEFGWSREQAIKLIVDTLDHNDIVVSTTGKTSRELFEYRRAMNQGHHCDFLTVGGMGHASQIAMGIAINRPKNTVICIDGDGAALMHMGSLAISGVSRLPNFKHVVINNGAHDSVGGHPTAALQISLTNVAKACGYKTLTCSESENDAKQSLRLLRECNGPALVELKVDRGSRANLGRPTTTPQENKQAFMNFLADEG